VHVILIIIASILGLIGVTLGLFALYVTISGRKMEKDLHDDGFYD
jgi:hypothetical protein